MDVLLEFRHGLGDAVQLTVVLEHLRHYQRDWHVDVASLVGKHSVFFGLARRSLILDRDLLDRAAYERVVALDWHECHSASDRWPATKATRCLVEVFGLAPLPGLCRYTVHVSNAARERARGYLRSICPAGPDGAGRFPVVLVHYQGNTSVDRKDLPHELAAEICDVVLRLGRVPVLLDWDRRSPLADGLRIFNPGAGHELWGDTGTGDGETLAALVEASSLMVGIDSGPLHVAGATSTPTIGVWTQHHPVHFFDLADNVTHLVPGDHARYAADGAVGFFETHYRHRVYRQLRTDLPALVESALTGEDVENVNNKRFLGQLHATAYGERYYTEHKEAGLDYLNYGDWQRDYGRWLVEALGWQGRRVLDVGCACGSILRGLGEAGAVAEGVELNEHMVQLGRQKWPDMTGLLHICDAVNLHVFPDASWDAIHTAQVAEHWKPELVPHILRELARVTRAGGLLFCCLDTVELFARQGRHLEGEDPTHVCIRPLAWWWEQAGATGWEVCTAEVGPALRSHPDSFLPRYDWDWFAARRAQ